MRPAAASLGMIVVLLACGDAGEQADRARERAAHALAEGERHEALAAIEALAESLPPGADAVSEQARLWVQAGETARAVWLLEDGARRHPEDVELRLLLAEAALLVNDPGRAQQALGALPVLEGERAARALLLRARAALALGDLDAALALFREAEERDPRSAAVRGPRIGALLAEGRLDEAATAVTDARRAAGDDADRRLARAFDLVLHQFRVDRARARWQQAAVAGDAQEARAAQEDLAGAVDGLGTLARAGERDTAAWQAWISGLVASGRADEATRAIAEARRADPEWAALPLLRAQALLANADEAGAETALRDALATDPDSGAALALARFLSTREREDEALDLLEAEAARGGDASLRASVLHERARLLLDAERSEAATQAIDAFAALRGEEDPATALLRARLTLLEGDAGDAAQQLMRLAPRLDSAATQYWLARALEVSGDLRGAERRYGLATIRAPSEPGAYAAIARLARQRGAWREAAAAGQQLVLRAPAAIDGWETLVDALLQLGELDAARETAQRCGELLIDTPEPLLLQARVSRAAGRGDEAQARLDQARERFGDSPQIRTEQVLLLSARRRGREALEAAERALAAPDLDALERSDLLHAKAISLFASRRFDAGAAAVDAALDAAPADLRPLRTRCQVAVSTGRLAVARLDCGRYVAAHPDDAGAHFAYGVALDQSDQAEAAVRAYERAAELDPHAAAPRNNLAHLRRQAGDLPGALQAAQQAYALAPDDAQVLDTLGELYLLEGLVGRARALLERAHELAPDDEAIARHLAVARSQHAADPAELSEP